MDISFGKIGQEMYCTELDKYCNEITDEECDGCCDTCIFCDVIKMIEILKGLGLIPGLFYIY